MKVRKGPFRNWDGDRTTAVIALAAAALMLVAATVNRRPSFTPPRPEPAEPRHADPRPLDDEELPTPAVPSLRETYPAPPEELRA